MADRRTDPGYCVGCGRLAPCTRTHRGEEKARIEQDQQRRGGR